jgi:NAD(P)-dependent dehydrogenase (short-subunit alcohol dehydrogenase family)
MNLQMDGLRVLVTAGARGIGLAAARAIAVDADTQALV